MLLLLLLLSVLFCSVLFCSGLHIASAYGTNGEHVAAPAVEAESYIRLCNIYNS